MTNYLTDRDVENYGTELIDLTQRAAAQVMSPQLQQIQQDHAMLQQRLAIESRRNLDQRVGQAVPDFRDVDRDARWHDWLRGTDMLSGRPRQTLLEDAIQHGDHGRIAMFFNQFKQQVGGAQQGGGQSMQHTAARRQQQAPGGGRIYSRSEIAQLYAAHRKGAYAGRDADWARQESDICRASAEGRITGGEPIGTK